MPQPTILIADDHTLFREGIRSICETLGRYKVVGEAANGRDAVEMARALQPDIILMDINMPGMDGVRATWEITRHTPDAKVIVLTMFQEETHLFDAIKAGARGYILKDQSSDKFLAGIRAVLDGRTTLPPDMAVMVLDEFRMLARGEKQGGKDGKNPGDEVEMLTPGEMAVLQLVARGCENKRIAADLDISQKTVSNRLSEIFSKLRVNNRTQAALLAIRRGWASLYPDEETRPN